MQYPDFEPWGNEEAAEADVEDMIIPAMEVQEALKLLLAGKYDNASRSLALSLNVAAYYASGLADTHAWEWEKSVLYGKKSGKKRHIDAKDIQAEWQEFANQKLKIRPWLSRMDIAQLIVKDIKKYNDSVNENKTIKVYSADYIRKKIVLNK